MAKTVFSVKDTAARKLLTELGEKKAKSWSPAKLKAGLTKLEDGIESLDEDLLESLSTASKKLLEKVVGALSKSKAIEITADEGDEPAPAKAGKAGKTSKSDKATSGGGTAAENRRAQGHAIDDVLASASGPMSLEDILAKASKKVPMKDTRVTTHLNWLESKGKVLKSKKGLYSVT